MEFVDIMSETWLAIVLIPITLSGKAFSNRILSSNAECGFHSLLLREMEAGMNSYRLHPALPIAVSTITLYFCRYRIREVIMDID